MGRELSLRHRLGVQELTEGSSSCENHNWIVDTDIAPNDDALRASRLANGCKMLFRLSLQLDCESFIIGWTIYPTTHKCDVHETVIKGLPVKITRLIRALKKFLYKIPIFNSCCTAETGIFGSKWHENSETSEHNWRHGTRPTCA